MKIDEIDKQLGKKNTFSQIKYRKFSFMILKYVASFSPTSFLVQ